MIQNWPWSNISLLQSEYREKVNYFPICNCFLCMWRLLSSSCSGFSSSAFPCRSHFPELCCFIYSSVLLLPKSHFSLSSVPRILPFSLSFTNTIFLKWGLFQRPYLVVVLKQHFARSFPKHSSTLTESYLQLLFEHGILCFLTRCFISMCNRFI